MNSNDERAAKAHSPGLDIAVIIATVREAFSLAQATDCECSGGLVLDPCKPCQDWDDRRDKVIEAVRAGSEAQQYLLTVLKRVADDIGEMAKKRFPWE